MRSGVVVHQKINRKHRGSSSVSLNDEQIAACKEIKPINIKKPGQKQSGTLGSFEEEPTAMEGSSVEAEKQNPGTGIHRLMEMMDLRGVEEVELSGENRDTKLESLERVKQRKVFSDDDKSTFIEAEKKKVETEACKIVIEDLLEDGGKLKCFSEWKTEKLLKTTESVRSMTKKLTNSKVKLINKSECMIVTKPGDETLISLTRDLAVWLITTHFSGCPSGLTVYIDKVVYEDRKFNLARVIQKNPEAAERLKPWTAELCAEQPDRFDFAVTLGGDGTLLYTSWLFQGSVPVIIPFALGSLGFLTIFDVKQARQVLKKAINTGVYVDLRMRFEVTVHRIADKEFLRREEFSKAKNAHMNRVEKKNQQALGNASGAIGAQSFLRSKRGLSRSPSTRSVVSRSGSTRRNQLHRRDTSDSQEGHLHTDENFGEKPEAPEENGTFSHDPVGVLRTRSTKSMRGAERRTGRRNMNSADQHGHLQAMLGRDRVGLSGRQRGNEDRSESCEPRTFSHISGRGLGIHTDNNFANHTLSDYGQSHQGSFVSISSPLSALSTKKGTTRAGSRRERRALGSFDSESTDDHYETPKQARTSISKEMYGRGDLWVKDKTYHVLNEVVIDRGFNPFLTVLELYASGRHLTTVQADGLSLSTPTGSTAYSLAAGGSLVHPEIPAILVTPICPHTLSFRPMLVPDTIELQVEVPPDSRNTAWVSFDGRNRIELSRGDHISVTASRHSVPILASFEDPMTSWFESLETSLSWNLRQRQKQMNFSAIENLNVNENEEDENSHADDEC
ncbi:ATP-NADH kinase YEF1 [Zancudomyces culisetae]|uniref:ATP-NADH kinase YEF1 n=1 Tax=Zancudomyces culisetae TaxID=1213189 RepID=A0A1R1PZL7_ZANCU|nr:ATP-NADH kinase YEF1 [Zancudomyces culisetae]|eukprot:OMH86396.1 ATP-NADH kinase YEF1 [Zancudomyces culisetae]